MSSQRLYELDKSSTRFPEQLNELLHDREWVKCFQFLPEDELSGLVGYLNDVRLIYLPAQPRSPPSQILDNLDPTGEPFRKCLHVLQKICSSRMTLPAMYEVSGTLLFSTTEVKAYGGFCDVYKGTLDTSDVCIKRLRISATGDRKKVKQVPHPRSL